MTKNECEICREQTSTYQWGKDSIPHEEETITLNTKKTYAEVLKELQDASKGEE